MHTKKRLLTLAAALFISLTACEGLPTEPTFGLETGEAALSLAAFGSTEVTRTLNFEDISIPKGSGVTLVPEYKKHGFTLTNAGGGFSSFGELNLDYVESTTLFPFGVTVLTKDDGEPFDVLSINLAEVTPLTGDPLSSVTIKFTGTKADESSGVVTVTHNLETDGDFGLEDVPLTFPTEFTDLQSLSWAQDFSFPHQFDDIVLRFESSGPLRDQCKNDGWRSFSPPFRNQGQCVRFVEKSDKGKDKVR